MNKLTRQQTEAFFQFADAVRAMSEAFPGRYACRGETFGITWAPSDWDKSFNTEFRLWLRPYTDETGQVRYSLRVLNEVYQPVERALLLAVASIELFDEETTAKSIERLARAARANAVPELSR